MAQTGSRGEVKIAEILDEAGIAYVREYVFSDLVVSSGRPLRFDFAVLDDNGDVEFLIEYQGEQHYQSVDFYRGKKGLQKQKYNDAQKKRFCADKGLTLICIPYWDYEILDYDYIMTKANFF